MATLGVSDTTNVTGSYSSNGSLLWITAIGTMPEDGTLDSVDAWIHSSGGSNNARLGVWIGGTSDTDPTGATLLADLGYLAASTGSPGAWETWTASSESLTSGDRVWIGLMNQGSCYIYSAPSGEEGDSSGSLRWIYNNGDAEVTTGFPGSVDPVASSGSGVSALPLKAILTYTPAPSGVSGSGAPAAQDATASGTAERELPSSGTPAAQASTVAGTAERVLLCSGELLSAASSVSGTAALQVKLLLTAAVNRELRDENGSPVANLAGIIFEWYDKDTDTDGAPDVSGTFSTNASGEATVQLAGSSLVAGQYGLLVLTHPTDNTIRGIYRIPVT